MKKTPLIIVFLLLAFVPVVLDATGGVAPYFPPPIDVFPPGRFHHSRDTCIAPTDTIYAPWRENLGALSDGTLWWACTTKAAVDSIGIEVQYAPFYNWDLVSIDTTFISNWYSLHNFVPATDSVGRFYLPNFGSDGWIPALGFFRTRWINYDASDSVYIFQATFHMSGSP